MALQDAMGKIILHETQEWAQKVPIKNATIYSDMHYYNILHSELQNVSFHWEIIFRN